MTSWKARADKPLGGQHGLARARLGGLGGNSAVTARPTMSSSSWASVMSATAKRAADAAVAQHGDLLAQLAHLGQPVGDVDDRHPAAREPAQLGEQDGGVVGAERRGGLVEDQHGRVGGHRLGDLEQVPLRDAQAAHPLGEVGPAADPGQLRPRPGAASSRPPAPGGAATSRRSRRRSGRGPGPGAGRRWTARAAGSPPGWRRGPARRSAPSGPGPARASRPRSPSAWTCPPRSRRAGRGSPPPAPRT